MNSLWHYFLPTFVFVEGVADWCRAAAIGRSRRWFIILCTVISTCTGKWTNRKAEGESECGLWAFPAGLRVTFVASPPIHLGCGRPTHAASSLLSSKERMRAKREMEVGRSPKQWPVYFTDPIQLFSHKESDSCSRYQIKKNWDLDAESLQSESTHTFETGRSHPSGMG